VVGNIVGFCIGVAAVPLSFGPIWRLIVCPEFFEQGCGQFDSVQPMLALFTALALGAVVGIFTAMVVNRWINGD